VNLNVLGTLIRVVTLVGLLVIWVGVIYPVIIPPSVADLVVPVSIPKTTVPENPQLAVLWAGRGTEIREISREAFESWLPQMKSRLWFAEAGAGWARLVLLAEDSEGLVIASTQVIVFHHILTVAKTAELREDTVFVTGGRDWVTIAMGIAAWSGVWFIVGIVHFLDWVWDLTGSESEREQAALRRRLRRPRPYRLL